MKTNLVNAWTNVSLYYNISVQILSKVNKISQEASDITLFTRINLEHKTWKEDKQILKLTKWYSKTVYIQPNIKHEVDFAFKRFIKTKKLHKFNLEHQEHFLHNLEECESEISFIKK